MGKLTTKGGPKAIPPKGFSPNPNVSATTGGKKGTMAKPTHRSSGAGANKMGGGRDSGAAKPL